MGFKIHIRTRSGTKYVVIRSLMGVMIEDTSERLPSTCCMNPTVVPLSSLQVAKALRNFAMIRANTIGNSVGF